MKRTHVLLVILRRTCLGRPGLLPVEGLVMELSDKHRVLGRSLRARTWSGGLRAEDAPRRRTRGATACALSRTPGSRHVPSVAAGDYGESREGPPRRAAPESLDHPDRVSSRRRVGSPSGAATPAGPPRGDRGTE